MKSKVKGSLLDFYRKIEKRSFLFQTWWMELFTTLIHFLCNIKSMKCAFLTFFFVSFITALLSVQGCDDWWWYRVWRGWSSRLWAARCLSENREVPPSRREPSESKTRCYCHKPLSGSRDGAEQPFNQCQFILVIITTECCYLQSVGGTILPRLYNISIL